VSCFFKYYIYLLTTTTALFFEINKAELLQVVPPDCCTNLTECPQFPGGPNDARPQVPREVLLISLKRALSNPLLSKMYDAQVFERVEVYFRRFYTPHDPSLKITLDSVDVIFNSEV
jgi:hypothetical protein